MAEEGAGIAGGVTVTIDGTLDPLAAKLAQAEQMIRAWDSRNAKAIPNSVSAAMANIATVGNQTTASLTRIAVPAANANAQIAKLGSQSVAAAAGMKGAAFQTANLAAQLNDIFVGLTSGQSGLTVGIQQGTQITQIIGQKGAAGAVAALGEAFTSLINPVSLSTIGIIAFGGMAVQAFAGMLPKIETANQAIQRHRQEIKDIVAGYGDAEKAADAYFDSQQQRPRGAALSDLQKQFADATAGSAKLKSYASLSTTSGC